MTYVYLNSCIGTDVHLNNIKTVHDSCILGFEVELWWEYIDPDAPTVKTTTYAPEGM